MAKREPRPSVRAMAKATGFPAALIRRIRLGEFGPESEEYSQYVRAIVARMTSELDGAFDNLSAVERTMAERKPR